MLRTEKYGISDIIKAKGMFKKNKRTFRLEKENL